MFPVRLLFDLPASGAWNMAVDEALLESAAGGGGAALRFYAWQEPTLSLGYFQSLGDRRQHAASSACPVVRRASGGGAILHDCELTYSLAVPAGTAAATALYTQAHESLIAALAEFNVSAALFRAVGDCRWKATAAAEPFLCFHRRTCTDVVLGRAKIAGSAQRRRRGAVLQHGSILLARSAFAPDLPGIGELTGVAIQPADLAVAWSRHLAHRLEARFTVATLSPEETARSHELMHDRFASEEFLVRR